MACEDPGVKDIVSTIASTLPAASSETIERELRNVLVKFFNESNSWREDITLNLRADKESYDISLVDEAAIVAWVLNVKDELGVGILPAARNNPVPQTNVFYQYTVNEPTVIKFQPIPDEAKTYTAEVSKQLKDGLLVMPQYISSHFREAIIDGVLGRMFMHTQKPYSDPNLGLRYTSSLSNQIVRARDIANRGFTTAASRWSFPRGFAKGTGHLRQN